MSAQKPISPGDFLEVGERIDVARTVQAGDDAGGVMLSCRCVVYRDPESFELQIAGLAVARTDGDPALMVSAPAPSFQARTLEGAQHVARLYLLDRQRAGALWAAEALDLVVDEMPRAIARWAEARIAADASGDTIPPPPKPSEGEAEAPPGGWMPGGSPEVN